MKFAAKTIHQMIWKVAATRRVRAPSLVTAARVGRIGEVKRLDLYGSRQPVSYSNFDACARNRDLVSHPQGLT